MIVTGMLALALAQDPRAETERAMRAYADLVADVSVEEGHPVWANSKLFGGDTGRREIVDGWGGTVIAELLVVITSLGADGAVGGTGLNADLDLMAIIGACGGTWASAIVVRRPEPFDSKAANMISQLFGSGSDGTVERMSLIAARVGRFCAEKRRLPRDFDDLGRESSTRDLWNRTFRLRYALRLFSFGADRRYFGNAQDADLSATFLVVDDRGEWLRGDDVRSLESLHAQRSVTGRFSVDEEHRGQIEVALGNESRLLHRSPLSAAFQDYEFDDVAEDQLTMFAGRWPLGATTERLVPLCTVTVSDGVVTVPYMYLLFASRKFRVVDGDRGASLPDAIVELGIARDGLAVGTMSTRTDANGTCRFDLLPYGDHRVRVLSADRERVLLDEPLKVQERTATDLLVVER